MAKAIEFFLYFFSKKSSGRSYLLFPSGRVLFKEFRKQRRNQIPRTGQSETQGHHCGCRWWAVVLHRRYNIVRVRGKDLQQEETEKTRKR